MSTPLPTLSLSLPAFPSPSPSLSWSIGLDMFLPRSLSPGLSAPSSPCLCLLPLCRVSSALPCVLPRQKAGGGRRSGNSPGRGVFRFEFLGRRSIAGAGTVPDSAEDLEFESRQYIYIYMYVFPECGSIMIGDIYLIQDPFLFFLLRSGGACHKQVGLHITVLFLTSG